MTRIVTLTTDFGRDNYFVASMKGVMLSINPDLRIVDVTHEIPRHNVLRAAITIWSCYKYFPKGTIHVVVVDPGVGTERRPLIIKSRNYYFVGPDNGVLYMAAEDDGIERTYEISLESKYVRRSISSTFHGRDVFAPVAAYLSLGVPPEEIGREIGDVVRLSIERPRFIDERTVECSVVYVDTFGNVYTSVREEDVRRMGLKCGQRVRVRVRDEELELPFVETYGRVPRGSELMLINSEGFLEIAVNMDSFAQRHGVREGDKIYIMLT